jgi:hypothetical protein
MSVIRVEKTRDYTVMSNSHLRSKSLSLKAKGLLSIMLSLPDEWDYTVAGLATLSADGLDSVRNALKELEHSGYLIRSQTKSKGKFDKSEYIVYEKPRTEKPLTENPTTENPMTEKPMQLNTNTSNTNQLNTNLLNTEGKAAKPLKPARHRYGEYNNVLLSDDELEKIKTELPTNWEQYIQDLSSYMASTGKSYKSHLATIRNWARKDQAKHRERTAPQQPKQETEEERLRREQNEKLLTLIEGRA